MFRNSLPAHVKIFDYLANVKRPFRQFLNDHSPGRIRYRLKNVSSFNHNTTKWLSNINTTIWLCNGLSFFFLQAEAALPFSTVRVQKLIDVKLVYTPYNPKMKKHSFFYRNGLSIVFLCLFVAAMLAQSLTGWKEHNQEREDEHAMPLDFSTYLTSGHFISSTFENFQSEFLQMALYVLLTVGLRQQGSAESKSLDEEEEVDREPKASVNAPGPVKKGGWQLRLYSNSLSIAFFTLFFISWGLHLYGSWQDHNAEQLLKGKAPESIIAYLAEPNFWFETFQNWQSEFLSVLSIVVLTIFLRQKGSPESKPVDAPHMETGK